MARLSRSGRIADYMAAAQHAAADHDWEQARTFAARALAFDPENVGARLVLDDVERTTSPDFGQAERRQLTVLFCDLEGSVALSEELDPEILRDVLLRYQELCHGVTRRHGGFLASYRGDGILAYFGYPSADEGDAHRAALAGLEMAAAVSSLTVPSGTTPTSLRPRIGIDTGLVVVGAVGAAGAPDPDAVTGLVPNLAARLQELAVTGDVLVSDITASLIETAFDLETRGPVSIRGLRDPLEVFAVKAERAASERRAVLRYRVSPLVGRDTERDILTRWWTSFADGPEPAGDHATRLGRSAAIVGPAGMGKSRLAWLMVDLARRHGAEVLEAECVPTQRGSDLAPVRQMLAGLLPIDRRARADDQAGLLQAGLEALGLDPDHAPFLADLLALSPDVVPLPALDPLEVHQRVHRSVVDLIEAHAAQRPVLVLLEDVQWADASTVEVVQRLLAAPHHRLFVLLTTRHPSMLPCEVDDLIALGPLDNASCHTLVRNVVGVAADDDIVASTVERSGGVPLFAVELARFHAAPQPVRTRLLGTGEQTMPPALADLIAGQLDSLGAQRRLAQAAAVIGREFPGALAGRLAGLGTVESGYGLNRLLGADLVETWGRDLYRFRHVMLHELAYETLLASERRELHERFADVLIETGATDPSIVAYHLARGGRFADAIVHHQIAALSAQERIGAHAVALHHLDAAMQLLGELPVEARPALELTTRVLRGLSRVFTESYASPSAADDYRRSLELCEELAYSPLIVPLTVAVWSYYTVSGDLRSADTVIDGLLGSPFEEAEFFRPEIETCAAIQRFYEGRFRDAAVHFAAAEAGFAGRGEVAVSPVWKLPNDPLVATWAVGAANSWLIGHDTTAGIEVARALERARSLPFPTGPFSECFALVGAVWLAELQRDVPASQEAAASLVDLASRHAYPFWHAVGVLRAAIATGRGGDPAAAAATVAETIELWHALGVKAYGPCNLANLAELRLTAGDLAGAATAVDESIAMAEATGERFYLAEALRIRGEIAAAAGDTDASVASLLEALAVSRQQESPRFWLRAAMALAQDVPAARQDPAWRDELAHAVAALEESDGPELASARALLRDLGRREPSPL